MNDMRMRRVLEGGLSHGSGLHGFPTSLACRQGGQWREEDEVKWERPKQTEKVCRSHTSRRDDMGPFPSELHSHLAQELGKLREELHRPGQSPGPARPASRSASRATCPDFCEQTWQEDKYTDLTSGQLSGNFYYCLDFCLFML